MPARCRQVGCEFAKKFARSVTSAFEIALTRWLARGEGVLRCCVSNSSPSAGSLDGSRW